VGLAKAVVTIGFAVNINPLCGAGKKQSGIDLVAVIEDFRGQDRKGSGGRT
jgi:hypothetical protein